MDRSLVLSLGLLLVVASTSQSLDSASELSLQRSAFDLLEVDPSGQNPILDALADPTVSQKVSWVLSSSGLSPLEKIDRIRISIGTALPFSAHLGSWGSYFDLVRLSLAPRVVRFRELVAECSEAPESSCRILEFLRGFRTSFERIERCLEEHPMLLCLRRLESPRWERANERLLQGVFSIVDLKHLAHFEHVRTSGIAFSSVSPRRNGVFPLLRDLDNTLRCPIVKRSARSVFPDLRSGVARILAQWKHRPAPERVEKVAEFISEFVARRHPDVGEMYRIFDIFQDVLIESKWGIEPSCAFPESFFDGNGALRVDVDQKALLHRVETIWRETRDFRRVMAALRGMRLEDAQIGLWGSLATMMEMC
uniref:Secreted protein n=1 Tax=Steinernema glaseri TaxID=37863 RepID=A0A1I8AG88_9BILA